MTRSGRILFAAGLVAAGCLGEGDDAAPGAAGSGPGVVRGTIEYRGELDGPLIVGVFGGFPPRGAPVATQVIDSPVFPQEYRIQGVPAGRWFVLAIIDTDPSDGDRYHPLRDPGGAYGSYAAPWSVTVDATAGAAAVDIDLVEPSAASPWAGGGYR